VILGIGVNARADLAEQQTRRQMVTNYAGALPAFAVSWSRQTILR